MKTLRVYLDASVVGGCHDDEFRQPSVKLLSIVHLDKIRGFNAVNLREGYLPIEIRSPLEVV